MSRPPAVPPEDKTRLVLSILAGEMSIAEAARRAKVSEQSVSNWKRQFIEAGPGLGLHPDVDLVSADRVTGDQCSCEDLELSRLSDGQMTDKRGRAEPAGIPKVPYSGS